MSTEELIAGWLPPEYDYERPRRGQIRKGMIVKVDNDGVFVDVGLKRDGFVPMSDLITLGHEFVDSLEYGQEVITRIVRPQDRDGNLVLSLSEARMEEDWKKAQEFLVSGVIWRGEVNGENSGGLLVPFGHLQGFIPAYHIAIPAKKGQSPEERRAELRQVIGQEIPLKVIEVDRSRNRLVLSERLARQQIADECMERLLADLEEGQVCEGNVRALYDFGAFMDLGGADGLIHVSELDWQPVKHPGDVLRVGQKVRAQVLRIDRDQRRISLSIKRLQPDPWVGVEELFAPGQLVAGKVTHVVDFGAFVALRPGIEGLIHVSEMADPPPPNPRDLLHPGDKLLLRVQFVDPQHKRISLSLKRVDANEQMTSIQEVESELLLEETESVPLSDGIIRRKSRPVQDEEKEATWDNALLEGTAEEGPALGES